MEEALILHKEVRFPTVQRNCRKLGKEKERIVWAPTEKVEEKNIISQRVMYGRASP